MKICIDPGHGHGNGAVGRNGLDEDSVVLSISTELAAKLNVLGLATKLTRSTDVLIELSERASMANTWHADYFVSIHCNSNGPSAIGIETLFKSPGGKALATSVQRALIYATGEVNRGLKYRDDLYVLNATNMPAILVEVGFISHPATEEKLDTSEYRSLLAEAIAKGIATYLNLQPLPPMA